MTAQQIEQILENLAVIQTLSAVRQKFFSESMQELPERTRTILVMRYGLDGKKSRTLEECGRPYMITRERVRGIQAKGRLQLKKKIQFKAKMAQINQSFD
jgi:DNA-directed RNA polymerase sigma subunit (sigma70/sigma32)